MTSISADEAEKKLRELIAEVGKSHEPIQIIGEGNQAVLIAEEDWRSIQETLHLLTVPGMRESILEGKETPVEDCSENPSW